ncbi:MAG: gamma carbonic anhydrase family protein, partial [Clostridiaceae bacterium]
KPFIHSDIYTAENSTIVGAVEIGSNSSVWFGAVIRGDENSIKIGSYTNVQDNAVIYVDKEHKVQIGDKVTIGHGAIIHGCLIEDEVLIGMGSIVLNNAKIGKNTIIGAGALVTQDSDIPSGVLCLGAPAKVIRNLTESEKLSIRESAKNYAENSAKYKKEEI